MTDPETLPLDAAQVSAAGEPAKLKAVAKSDKHIWGIYIALCIISVIELYSASSREVSGSSLGVLGPILRHVCMLGLGTLIVWAVSRTHYSKFILWGLLFALASVATMVYVMFFGEEINGARRSLTLLGFSVFPAEMVKISAVVLIAIVMTWNANPKKVGVTSKAVIYSGVIVLILSGLLIEQGLTNTLLLLAISYSMMIIGGVRIRDLVLLTLAYAVCGAIFIGSLFIVENLQEKRGIPADSGQPTEQTVSTDTKKKPGRIATWIARLDRHGNDSVPKWEIEPTGINRQEILSYMAQAHGGVYGVGPGNSREASRLPLAFSDYIYAIIIEELGVIGGIVVLVLYLWLLGRAAGIASHATRTFPALLVIGMAVMIAFQALFHIAIVTGVAPVSGQPLPLLSKGGTSIFITSLAFGVMLSVSRTATRHSSKKQDIREEIDTLPEEMGAENQMQL